MQSNNDVTLDKLIETIKDAYAHGYPPTVIINGEYYCVKGADYGL